MPDETTATAGDAWTRGSELPMQEELKEPERIRAGTLARHVTRTRAGTLNNLRMNNLGLLSPQQYERARENHNTSQTDEVAGLNEALIARPRLRRILAEQLVDL